MITTDKINHPPHYTSHPSGVECIQITEHFSFNVGNAIKYLWRADEKGAPLDDLKKAGWYIEREITRRIDSANTSDFVTKSASSPDARRQYEMGNMCYSGDGMPQDIDHAKEWWTLAAAQGNLDAQKALDACKPPAAEIDARLADIRRQAAGGDRSAQQYLSDCYRHGWYGLLILPEMETMWHNRANEPRIEEEDLVTKSASSPNLTGTTLAYAQAGDARRQYQMGKMCYYGDGMPQDSEQAVEWWQKAAEQGNYEAQVSLVCAYRTGEGVEKNQRLANYWLEKANSQRAKDAQ